MDSMSYYNDPNVSMKKLKQNNDLLDAIKKSFSLRTDAKLSRFIGWKQPNISKIRSGTNDISDSMIIRVHEATGWGMADIKQRLGLATYIP